MAMCSMCWGPTLGPKGREGTDWWTGGLVDYGLLAAGRSKSAWRTWVLPRTIRVGTYSRPSLAGAGPAVARAARRADLVSSGRPF